MQVFPDLSEAVIAVHQDMRRSSQRVHTERWQGIDISRRPEAEMHELLFTSFQAPMPDTLKELRFHLTPNLPWADDHFLERVGGEPINPGEQWKHWPWANSASGHLDANGKFSHNYMERYWPRYAGMNGDEPKVARRGIYHEYGDLMNVVQLLSKEPLTRQAYFPVWFPEDTGDIHSERKPCSLGYHFILRDGRFHVVYYIRSCDLMRHFRDDIYLTIRLAMWVKEKCAERNSKWEGVKLGQFVMHITSLHLFRNDFIKLFGGR